MYSGIGTYTESELCILKGTSWSRYHIQVTSVGLGDSWFLDTTKEGHWNNQQKGHETDRLLPRSISHGYISHSGRSSLLMAPIRQQMRVPRGAHTCDCQFSLRQRRSSLFICIAACRSEQEMWHLIIPTADPRRAASHLSVFSVVRRIVTESFSVAVSSSSLIIANPNVLGEGGGRK